MRVTKCFVRVADGRHDRPDLLGFASLILEGDGLAIGVESIRIVRLPDGRITLSWPSRRVKGPDPVAGRPTRLDSDRQPYYFRDTCHPMDARTRAAIERRVLPVYLDALAAGELARVEDFAAPAALAG